MIANLNSEQASAALELLQKHRGEPVTITNGEPHGEPAMDRVLIFSGHLSEPPAYAVDVFGFVKQIEPRAEAES